MFPQGGYFVWQLLIFEIGSRPSGVRPLSLLGFVSASPAQTQAFLILPLQVIMYSSAGATEVDMRRTGILGFFLTWM